MAKDYINRDNKKRIGRLALISEYIEAIVNEMDGYEHPFSLKYLKMAKSFLYKFVIEEVIQNDNVDNSDRRVIKRIVEKGKMKFENCGTGRYSRASRNHSVTKNNKIVEVSQDYVDDILNLLITNTCLDCQVKPENVKECEVRKKLIMGEVPILSKENKCRYEIKLSEAHKYKKEWFYGIKL